MEIIDYMDCIKIPEIRNLLKNEDWRIRVFSFSPYNKTIKLHNRATGKSYYCKIFSTLKDFLIEKNVYALVSDANISFKPVCTVQSPPCFLILTEDKGYKPISFLLNNIPNHLAYEIGRKLALFHVSPYGKRRSICIPSYTFEKNLKLRTLEFVNFLRQNKTFVTEGLQIPELREHPIKNKIDYLEEISKKLEEIIQNIKINRNDSQQFLVHGDFYRDNILVRYSRDTNSMDIKFIDFDNAHYGDRREDFIRFFTRGLKKGPYYSIKEMKPIDKSLWKSFLEGYSSVMDPPQNLNRDYKLLLIHDLLVTINYYLNTKWHHYLNSNENKRKFYLKLYNQLLCLYEALIEDASDSEII